MSKRICLVTDTWKSQVNGVVTTLTHLHQQLIDRGYTVTVISPNRYKCYKFPLYKEVNMPWNLFEVYKEVGLAIQLSDYVHIATEGPIGLMARLYCHRHNIKYITSYHTRFPEYAHARWKSIPLKWGYAVMRWMHNRASSVLVTTESMKEELDAWGIENMIVWNRGVDTNLFRPLTHIQRNPNVKVLGYVGRVSVEKNLEAFLDLPDELGVKVVVGDGPDLKRLKKRYKNVLWLGYKFGDELVEAYNSLDVMVFPSKTDTFGLVNLESMACGTPVAAYPVTGPKDIIEEGVTGAMDEDLEEAVKRALTIDSSTCMLTTRNNHSWNNALRPYVDALIEK